MKIHFLLLINFFLANLLFVLFLSAEDDSHWNELYNEIVVQARINDHKKAIQLSDKLLDYSIKKYGKKDLKTIEVLDALAYQYRLLPDKVLSEKYYLEMLTILENLKGEESSKKLATTYYALANLYYCVQNYYKAKKFYEKSINVIDSNSNLKIPFRVEGLLSELLVVYKMTNSETEYNSLQERLKKMLSIDGKISVQKQ